MTEAQALTSTIYQVLLIKALTPLTPEQLALSAVPTLRSIEDIAKHVIGARARWFYKLMGEGGEDFADLSTWDREGMPERNAADWFAAWRSHGRVCRKRSPAGRRRTGNRAILATTMTVSLRLLRGSGLSGTLLNMTSIMGARSASRSACMACQHQIFSVL